MVRCRARRRTVRSGARSHVLWRVDVQPKGRRIKSCARAAHQAAGAMEFRADRLSDVDDAPEIAWGAGDSEVGVPAPREAPDEARTGPFPLDARCGPRRSHMRK